MSYLDEIQKNAANIKLLAEELLQSIKRQESITKYKLILAETDEMISAIEKVRQHANIEIHLIESKMEMVK